MIRAAFFGTPRAAVPILQALAGAATVSPVVTRPDRPRGRSGRLRAPPVKEAALDLGLEVLQPKRPAGVAESLIGLDVAVVAAYGRIIPEDMLSVPGAGFVNVHFSLLPRWRGASPVARAILAGDSETGVTLMQMDAGLDTGPVLATTTTVIDPGETAGTLESRLAELGAGLVVERLQEIVAGRVAAEPQDEAAATAAAKVTVAEAYVDPHRHSPEAVLRAIRAFNPKPGAWSSLEGERIKLWEARPSEAAGDPGVASRHEGAVVLGLRGGSVELMVVQPAGKAAMSADAWMNGRRGREAVFDQPASGIFTSEMPGSGSG